MLVTEEVHPMRRRIETSEVVEVVPFYAKRFNGNLSYPLIAELGQNAPVLPEDVVDAPDVFAVVRIGAIMEGTSALIGTKLLIHAALERLPAFKACF
jgi:hypothetical protein